MAYKMAAPIAIIGRWEAKLVTHPLGTAALWVRIQTSRKNTKWVKISKRQSSPLKNKIKKMAAPDVPVGFPAADHRQGREHKISANQRPV
jgi:hypothetical protein